MAHFGDWPGRWAECEPNRLAIINADDGSRLTYAQFNQRINQYVSLLAKGFDVLRGERVAVLAMGSSEVFAIQFACYRLGAVFAPLNWRLSAQELQGIVEDCEPSVLIGDGNFSEQMTQLGKQNKVPLHCMGERPLPKAARMPAVSLEADELAMLLYTSGTTGRAKGAMLSHKQLFYNALNTLQACDLRSDDRVLAFLPLFHTGGLNCLAGPVIYRGGVVVIMGKFDAHRALATIREHKISLAIAVPTMFRMLLEAGLPPRCELPHVRMLLSGGAPCDQALLNQYWDLDYDLRQGFGMTEVGPNCFTLGRRDLKGRSQTVGKPAFHGAARIVSEQGAVVGAGVVGELQLLGPHVMQGYWKLPDATSEAFDDEWFCTGDLAFRDDEGFYFIVGRQKDMFISGGENIYPAEIERVLSDHPGVAEACVVAVPDKRWGEVALAAIETHPGRQVAEVALRQHCSKFLARYKVPKYFHVIESLPRNASGKAIKAKVKEMLWEPDSSQ